MRKLRRTYREQRQPAKALLQLRVQRLQDKRSRLDALHVGKLLLNDQVGSMREIVIGNVHQNPELLEGTA